MTDHTFHPTGEWDFFSLPLFLSTKLIFPAGNSSVSATLHYLALQEGHEQVICTANLSELVEKDGFLLVPDYLSHCGPI